MIDKSAIGNGAQMVSGIDQAGKVNRSSSEKSRTVADLRKVARDLLTKEFEKIGGDSIIDKNAVNTLADLTLNMCLDQHEQSIKSENKPF